MNRDIFEQRLVTRTNLYHQKATIMEMMRDFNDDSRLGKPGGIQYPVLVGLLKQSPGLKNAVFDLLGDKGAEIEKQLAQVERTLGIDA